MMARKGFTLVELLLVVLILAILAAIVVPRLAATAADANKAACAANWANLVRALELYATDNEGRYPVDQAAFDSLILNSSKYFPHGAPECPYGAEDNPYVYDNTAGAETVVRHNH
jgi:general secretion pathway protein G